MKSPISCALSGHRRILTWPSLSDCLLLHRAYPERCRFCLSVLAREPHGEAAQSRSKEARGKKCFRDLPVHTELWGMASSVYLRSADFLLLAALGNIKVAGRGCLRGATTQEALFMYLIAQAAINRQMKTESPRMALSVFDVSVNYC